MTTPTTIRREGRIPPPAAPTGELELRSPPTLLAADGTLSGILVTAVPMLGSVGSVAFVALGGNGSLHSYLAAGMFLLASLGFVGASLWRSRSGRSAQVASHRREYLGYLVGVRQQVRTAVAEQRRHLTWVHPSPTALASLVQEGTRVWERSSADEDWLFVRYASGPQLLGLELRPGDVGAGRLDPVCAGALRRLVATHRVLPELPTTISLSGFARIEVVGRQDRARALARAMLAQAATFHAPDRLVVAVLTSADQRSQWDWVKWLPHAHSRNASDAAGPRRLVVTDLDELVGLLPGEVADRPRFGPQPTEGDRAHVVVVLDGGAVPAGHPVLTDDGVQGVTVLDLAPQGADVGDGTRVRLRLDGGDSEVSVSALVPRRDPVRGVADQLSIPAAEAVARRLTRRYGGDGPARDDALARHTELTDLLGIDDIGRLDLDHAWRRRPPRDRLRVPIGVGADGEPVSLDLKESAQQGMGPHGLVIGATGSGKSELLRTLVLGLALTHSPEDLNLVLVDFKGGATFAGMATLPHVSALITNLADELTLVDRMQDALTGELVRRQELLRAAGNQSSLRDYEAARRSGEAPHLPPVPSLLVVCDEFSELLAAKPEFVDLFGAIGRLGRSLGVHLLLASQRLDEGRLRGLDSHLSYRIGLRTFSAAESRSVIGVGDAHVLPPVPGLGFLVPDPSTLTRFKAAYVSGPPRPQRGGGSTRRGAARAEVLPFVVGEVTSRAGSPAEVIEPAASRAHSRTVLDLAVEAMAGRGPAAHQIWHPPLDVPETFDRLLPDLAEDADLGLVSRSWRALGPLHFPLGAIDLPLEQRRDVLRVDLSGATGHVAVVGSPRSGRSTVLRSLVTGLALTHTPLEVQVYVLDFGGGTFTGLRLLPHVAGVATRSDPDVVSRVVAEVVGLTDAREQFFRRHGIDTIETYRVRRRAGEVDDGWGDVVLVVDGWSTLRTDFPDLEPELQALAQRSLTFGVHLVTSATRWMDYRTGVRDVLGTRLELRLGDPIDSEVDRRLAANVPLGRPGRGIVRSQHHVLGALPRIDGDPSTPTLAAGVAHLVDRVTRAWTGPAGPKLRLLPTLVELEALRDASPSDPRALLGISERALGPVGLDTERDPHLLVFGEARSGKSGLLRTYLREVTRLHTPETAQLFVVDYRRAHLGEFPEEWVADYATSHQTASELAAGLATELEGRLPGPGVTPGQLRHRTWWQGKEAFVVVDDYELVATSQGNPLLPIVPLLAQATDIGLHVVLARRSGGAGRLADAVVTMMHDLAQPGVVLSGDPADGPLVGSVRPVPAPPGRGRMVTRDGVDVIQVAWSPSVHD